jgi:hypothetical protein
MNKLMESLEAHTQILLPPSIDMASYEWHGKVRFKPRMAESTNVLLPKRQKLVNDLHREYLRTIYMLRTQTYSGLMLAILMFWMMMLLAPVIFRPFPKLNNGRISNTRIKE